MKCFGCDNSIDKTTDIYVCFADEVKYCLICWRVKEEYNVQAEVNIRLKEMGYIN